MIMLFMVLVLLILAACEDENTETYTLSGTITKSGVNDGIIAYMKLVSPGAGMTAAALYFTEATFSGGAATYSVSDIEEGEYTLFSFIDVNGNAGGETSAMPDAGDYVTSTDVNIEDDKTLDAPENFWQVYQP